MRILWITHDVLEPFFFKVIGKPTRGGSWISPLFYSLSNNASIVLSSVSPVIGGLKQKEVIDNITYYSIPIKKRDNTSRMTYELAEKYIWAINDFKPDILHIHGTENNFGQLREFLDHKIPIVCSIQGIINAYYPFLKYSVSNINLNKYKSIKNQLGKGGVSGLYKRWNIYASIEKDIIEKNRYYIGRTLWDKAHVLALNSKAEYFHGEELLRPVFYHNSWNNNKFTRHRIFVSSAAYPIKGFHVLIDAIGILKQKYPNIQVVVPLSSFNLNSSWVRDILFTEDYGNYLKKSLKKLEIDKNIIFFDRLTAEEMANEYKAANVFILPSFIENSPNSLGESMMIGTPAIVSQVGGIMSFVKDEESVLSFPAGDSAMLAYQIDRLFSDDELAIKLSQNAKLIAHKRHNIESTTNQYLDIYEQVILRHNNAVGNDII